MGNERDFSIVEISGGGYGPLGYTLFVGGKLVAFCNGESGGRFLEQQAKEINAAFSSAVKERVEEAVVEESATCAAVGGHHFSQRPEGVKVQDAIDGAVREAEDEAATFVERFCKKPDEGGDYDDYHLVKRIASALRARKGE